MPEGLHLCTINPTGFIETQDGARIRFDGRGYGIRSSEKYQTNLALVFGTEDVRYQWLYFRLATGRTNTICCPSRILLGFLQPTKDRTP